MRTRLMIILALAVLVLSACEKPAFISEYLGPTTSDDNYTVLPPGEGINVEVPDEPVMTETPGDTMEKPKEDTTPPETELDTDKYVKKVVMEGELIELSPEAIDPDGDVIKYTFSKPLGEDGTWQTKKGDAGQYLVTVTASDGRLETTQKIVIVVQSRNKAPSITGLDDISVKEGQTVELDFTVEDIDGDDVEVTITGWMSEKTYKTTFTDAGEHTVKVTAYDGEDQTAKTITVTVENVNRKPVFKDVEDIMAVEEDEIKLDFTVTDADADDVVFTYSTPFNEDGEWQTEVGDAGEYEVTVTASDGIDEVETSFTLTVKELNNAPVIEEIDDITLDEGQTVRIEPDVTDADGDDVEVTFSGWMTESTYKTSYDDAGTYTVTVTASDGKASVSRDVKVTVEDVNRPPQFVLVG